MITQLKLRISELESEYRKYFDLDSGPSKSYSGAACMRSRIKQKLNTCHLLLYLLMYVPDTMLIDNKDLCDTFDRLTEPRRK